MKCYVYALYSPYLGCYDLPTVSEHEPERYSEMYRRLIKSDQERSFSVHAEEKKLCYIADFDDITGILSPLASPLVLADLSSFFDKDFLLKKSQSVQEVHHG